MQRIRTLTAATALGLVSVVGLGVAPASAQSAHGRAEPALSAASRTDNKDGKEGRGCHKGGHRHGGHQRDGRGGPRSIDPAA